MAVSGVIQISGAFESAHVLIKQLSVIKIGGIMGHTYTVVLGMDPLDHHRNIIRSVLGGFFANTGLRT